jgi:hypothetical protein
MLYTVSDDGNEEIKGALKNFQIGRTGSGVDDGTVF